MMKTRNLVGFNDRSFQILLTKAESETDTNPKRELAFPVDLLAFWMIQIFLFSMLAFVRICPTRIGSTNLVLVNPYKSLANVDDASADYLKWCFRDPDGQCY